MAAISTKQIAVLGGGIAGLAAAQRLVDKVDDPRQITLIESSQRLGGWMQTFKTVHGSIFESGPRRLRPVGEAGRATLQLAYDLGLEDEILAVPSSAPAATNRFIYSQGELHMIPNSLSSVFKRQPLLGNKSVLPLLLKEPFKAKGDPSGESVHQFFERRLNKEVADMLVDPFCRGIFGGDARQLSVKACFPPLCKYEEDYGSLVKGMYNSYAPSTGPVPDIIKQAADEKWSTWTLSNGVESIVKALEKHLKYEGIQILTGENCRAIDFKPDGVHMTMENRELKFDHVISAAPSFALRPLVASKHKTLADLLSQIPWVSMGVVSLEYDGNVTPVEGFGFLVPSSEKSIKSMGVIFESCGFPEHDRPGEKSSRFSVMMGGQWFEDLFGDPDSVDSDDLVQNALHTMKTALDVKQEPFFVISNVLKHCIPQYMVGHPELLSSMYSYIEKNNLPLTLIGSSYEGVGVNDCILNAQKAVDNL